RLGIPQPVKRLTFLNHGMEGRLKAFGKIRTGEDRWVEMDSKRLQAGKREVELKFAPIDVAFVRLKFELETGGAFSGLGLFGAGSARDYWTILEPSTKRSAVFDPEALNYSLTNSTTGARVLWVSSSARSGTVAQLLDEDILTYHTFSRDDRQPGVVIDLGDTARIGRISAAQSEFSGQWHAVMLNDEERIRAVLNSKQDEFAALFEGNEDLLSMESEPNDADMAFHQVDRKGRFVLLRWIADEAVQAPFFLRELAVFSMDPPRIPGRGTGKNPIDQSIGKDGLAGGPGNGFGSPGSESGHSGIPGMQTSNPAGDGNSPTFTGPGIPFSPPGGSFTGGGVNPLFSGESTGGSPIPGLPTGGPIIRPVSN
ncbi:MAG: hypothetical protein AAF514_24345, partial [Verrucomicrobiota bacterium]